MQVAELDVGPGEERRLRNRALARWLISAGPARLRPDSQQMSAELVVHNGRAHVAVTAPGGQVLALYPVSGTGEHRRLYKAVPVPAGPAASLARPHIPDTAHAALLTQLQDSRAALSALTSRVQALRETSALLCAHAQALRATSSALRSESAALRARAA